MRLVVARHACARAVADVSFMARGISRSAHEHAYPWVLGVADVLGAFVVIVARHLRAYVNAS